MFCKDCGKELQKSNFSSFFSNISKIEKSLVNIKKNGNDLKRDPTLDDGTVEDIIQDIKSIERMLKDLHNFISNI